MINDHILLQKHLIYFEKTFYIIRNLKNKSEPSSPLLNPQSKHTLSVWWDVWMNFSLIVFNFLWCRSEPMDIYPVDSNTMLVAVCFNGGKPNLFKVRVDVTLVDLKDQHNQINQRLNHRNTRKVCLVSTSIDRVGCFFTQIFWRYSQEFDSAIWRCLGWIKLYYYVVSLFCWN